MESNGDQAQPEHPAASILMHACQLHVCEVVNQLLLLYWARGAQVLNGDLKVNEATG